MTAEPRYPFLHVEVGASDAEEVSAELFSLGASGVEERDDQTLSAGPGRGTTLLVASFDDRTSAEEALAAIRDHEAVRSCEIEEIVGDAWRDAWKEHYRPFSLTPTITVVPPWLTYEAVRPNERILELEPGRAFGTGLHATTSLVAALLEDRRARLPETDVLDAGTGSGILALAALLLGARRAVAFDIDPDVIEVVRQNATRNRLDERLEVFDGTAEQVEGRFGLVLANIETRVLCRIADELAASVAPGGEILLSGVLESEAAEVVRTFEALPRGLSVGETRVSGEHERSLSSGDQDRWVAIALSAAR